ncbi:MAG: hypothetical protein PUA49_07205 [Butyrivibrio sp.]|nr:hypothetical protein [Butyrivibrio sp.]
MGTKSLDIMIIALLAILFIAQVALAVKQIKSGAPDGKILLIVGVIVMILFVPLSVFKLIYNYMAIKIVWFIVAAAYMIFTIWYTKQLQKSYRNQ